MTILLPSTDRAEKLSGPSLVAKGLKKTTATIAAIAPTPPIRIARRSNLTRDERRLALAKACSRLARRLDADATRGEETGKSRHLLRAGDARRDRVTC